MSSFLVGSAVGSAREISCGLATRQEGRLVSFSTIAARISHMYFNILSVLPGYITTRMSARTVTLLPGGIGLDGKRNLTGWRLTELTFHSLLLAKKKYGDG